MCGPSSWWAKISLLVSILALALHIAGWATTSWMEYSTTNGVIDYEVGLWSLKSCNSGTCTTSSVTSTYETDEFQAVRAFETIAFIVATVGVVLLLIYTCARIVHRHSFALAIMIVLFVTATASFIGMVIFVAKIPSPFEVSWSLGLTVVGMTLFLIAGTLMIPDAFEPDGHADYYGYQKQGRPSSRGITPITFQDAARWGNY